MIQVAAECLPDSVHIVVLDTKLLAGLADNGCDEGVVRLDHSGKEVMGGLVVESTCKYIPEPTVCCVILCGGHLHLGPEEMERVIRLISTVSINSPVLVHHLVLGVRFGPFHLRNTIMTLGSHTHESSGTHYLANNMRCLKYQSQPVATNYLPNQIV